MSKYKNCTIAIKYTKASETQTVQRFLRKQIYPGCCNLEPCTQDYNLHT